MKETEHNEKTPCCWIVGAGPCGGLHAEGFAPKKEDYIIAADGGLRYLEDAGVSPNMVVGDFDTLGYEPEHENVVRLSVRKDWTDTFVAMEKGAARGYRTFVFHGCLGGKLEHTVANLQHLVWLAQRGMKGWMTDGRVWATAICGNNGAKSGRLNLPARDRGMVSVFCMGDCAKGVTLKGLKYTLEDAQLTGSFPLGVSNELIGEPADIEVKEGTLLVVMECEAE
ncbi:MAG: thiamine diphosphokinase [Firmicutes bacterium]|nr:thiamine diphosphokinase [Bacillota bacterium]MDY5855386.1 thiamine diphosphokinase [Anaerovoracaceae bacterium]